MDGGYLEWAGVRFTALSCDDVHPLHKPGLFGLVSRIGGRCTLLYVGHAEDIALGHRPPGVWEDALALGLNELHVALHVTERIDRLLLRGHIVRRCEPLLNLVGDPGCATPPGSDRALKRA